MNMRTFIVKLKDDSFRRLNLSQSVYDEMSNLFGELESNYSSDKEEVEFDGSYNADESEVFILRNFKITEDLKAAGTNPLGIDELNSIDFTNIKVFFTMTIDNAKITISGQAFDIRKIIEHKFLIYQPLASQTTLNKLTSAGLVVDSKIDFLFKGSQLLFYSYHNARKIFDLSDAYREATDDDLKTFSGNALFHVEDQNTLVKEADSFIRKKIALIEKNKVLEKVDIAKIRKQSKQYEINIEFIKKKGKEYVKIPSDKKAFKELIRFLDEDYFTAPLTDRKCITNSKKYL